LPRCPCGSPTGATTTGSHLPSTPVICDGEADRSGCSHLTATLLPRPAGARSAAPT
jgi:hypothetical protein